MKTPFNLKTLPLSIAFFSTIASCNYVFAADSLPFEFDISPYSEYSADEIYVAVVGYQDDGYAFLELDNNFEINKMDSSDNTLAGPDGDSYTYIDMFKPLSEIEDQTIMMPQFSSVRMYIGFGSTLYIRYDTISDSGGYVAPTLWNEGSANYGIRYEMVELTYNDYGLWTNTTRVDSYQYPMGLEVWGADDFYKRVGELLTHDEIVLRWQEMTVENYQFENLYGVDEDYDLDIIVNPSHHEDFSSGGQYEDYFDDYVDAVWDRYSSENLCLSIGDAGKWVGRVNGDVFQFMEYTGSDSTSCNSITVSAEATISDQPSTYEIMSASGVLTSGGTDDLNIQKHFAAAFNRGAIDLNADYDEWVEWSDSDDFFNNDTYDHNKYVEFWHNEEISYEGETYAFAYDDVFDYSSTIYASDPESILITIGGFAAEDFEYDEVSNIELSCDSLSLFTGETATIDAELTPYDSSSLSIYWSSSDSSIVYVDDGEIEAISTGTATITASAYTGDGTDSCQVTVTDAEDAELIERIEAEDYIDMSGIQTETTSDEDGGENVGWIDPDDWMEYSIDIPSSGTYQLDFRLAAPFDTGSFDVIVDDETLASVDVNYTGTYQSWETQSAIVELEEGEQVLTIYVTGDGWNINWFEIYSIEDSNDTTDTSSDTDDSETTTDTDSDTTTDTDSDTDTTTDTVSDTDTTTDTDSDTTTDTDTDTDTDSDTDTTDTVSDDTSSETLVVDVTAGSMGWMTLLLLPVLLTFRKRPTC